MSGLSASLAGQMTSAAGDGFGVGDECSWGRSNCLLGGAPEFGSGRACTPTFPPRPRSGVATTLACSPPAKADLRMKVVPIRPPPRGLEDVTSGLRRERRRHDQRNTSPTRLHLKTRRRPTHQHIGVETNTQRIPQEEVARTLGEVALPRKYNDERQDLCAALGQEAHSADVIYGTRKGAKYLLQYVADTGRFKATFGDVSPYNYKHEDEDDASQPDIDHDYDWDGADDFGT
ncbi:hypothetical protein D9615_008771 [Tricholomella constricta]|uniref:Uncharacterized protein n=1 Tax=Tricholomella constricta TaxID=117010 RepID=A0A8H5M2L0_9AGAR|nr:hypothetical protein D9615_008771 [Tricholomella constricta]